MKLIKIEEYMAASIAMIGALLLAFKIGFGFVLWLFSDTTWIHIAHQKKMMGMFIMFSLFLIISIIGIINWFGLIK